MSRSYKDALRQSERRIRRYERQIRQIPLF
jgi:hypothetical protein